MRKHRNILGNVEGTRHESVYRADYHVYVQLHCQVWSDDDFGARSVGELAGQGKLPLHTETWAPCSPGTVQVDSFYQSALRHRT